METKVDSVWEKVFFATFSGMAIVVMLLGIVVGYKVIRFPSTEIGDNVQSDTKLAYEVIKDSRIAIDNANYVAIDGRIYYEKQIPDINQKIVDILNNSNAGITGLQTTNSKLQFAISSATNQVNSIGPVTSNLAKTIQDIDNVVNSNSVKNSLDNISETTEETKGTMANVQATTGDIHDAVHESVTHCNWLVKFLHLCPTKETK